METKWIPVFRTGTHTDSQGDTKTWTEQDLDKIAAYDPAKHEAPAVIGHPKDNAPAYAWIEGVKREGHMLYVRMKDVVPEFAEMLKKKMFKKRSISLYPDGTLRHVGFLGAMPPAIKGLPDVAFSDGVGLTIEFTEVEKESAKDNPRSIQTREEETKMNFWERLKKKLEGANVSFAELFGSETPPVLFTEADVQAKVASAVAAAVTTKEVEFKEALKPKEADLEKREKALRQKEAETRKTGITAFCEDLKKKGILTPAMEKLGMGITAFMEQIASIETPIEFGEGDGKGKQTPLEFMQMLLPKLPPQIDFKEVAGTGKDIGGTGGSAGEKLAVLIAAKINANKDLTYGAAFAEVQTENPELAAEYAEEIG